eukprot:g1796.t1
MPVREIHQKVNDMQAIDKQQAGQLFSTTLTAEDKLYVSKIAKEGLSAAEEAWSTGSSQGVANQFRLVEALEVIKHDDIDELKTSLQDSTWKMAMKIYDDIKTVCATVEGGGRLEMFEKMEFLAEASILDRYLQTPEETIAQKNDELADIVRKEEADMQRQTLVKLSQYWSRVGTYLKQVFERDELRTDERQKLADLASTVVSSLSSSSGELELGAAKKAVIVSRGEVLDRVQDLLDFEEFERQLRPRKYKYPSSDGMSEFRDRVIEEARLTVRFAINREAAARAKTEIEKALRSLREQQPRVLQKHYAFYAKSSLDEYRLEQLDNNGFSTHSVSTRFAELFTQNLDMLVQLDEKLETKDADKSRVAIKEFCTELHHAAVQLQLKKKVDKLSESLRGYSSRSAAGVLEVISKFEELRKLSREDYDEVCKKTVTQFVDEPLDQLEQALAKLEGLPRDDKTLQRVLASVPNVHPADETDAKSWLDNCLSNHGTKSNSGVIEWVWSPHFEGLFAGSYQQDIAERRRTFIADVLARASRLHATEMKSRITTLAPLRVHELTWLSAGFADLKVWDTYLHSLGFDEKLYSVTCNNMNKAFVDDLLGIDGLTGDIQRLVPKANDEELESLKDCNLDAKNWQALVDGGFDRDVVEWIFSEDLPDVFADPERSRAVKNQRFEFKKRVAKEALEELKKRRRINLVNRRGKLYSQIMDCVNGESYNDMLKLTVTLLKEYKDQESETSFKELLEEGTGKGQETFEQICKRIKTKAGLILQEATHQLAHAGYLEVTERVKVLRHVEKLLQQTFNPDEDLNINRIDDLYQQQANNIVEEAKREINPEKGELPERLLLFTGKDDGKSRIQRAEQALDALKEGNPDEARAKLTKLTGLLRDAYQNDLRLMCGGLFSLEKKAQLYAKDHELCAKTLAWRFYQTELLGMAAEFIQDAGGALGDAETTIGTEQVSGIGTDQNRLNEIGNEIKQLKKGKSSDGWPTYAQKLIDTFDDYFGSINTEVFNQKAAGARFDEMLDQVRVLSQDGLESLVGEEGPACQRLDAVAAGWSKSLDRAYAAFKADYDNYVRQIASDPEARAVNEKTDTAVVANLYVCDFHEKLVEEHNVRVKGESRASAVYEKRNSYLEQTKSLVKTMKANRGVNADTFRSQPENTGKLLAHCFAMWSLTQSFPFNGKNFEVGQRRGSTNATSVKQPHPSQVLAILCMLGTGSPKGLVDQLSQVKTGEGKSISLGMLSTVFALFGISVTVVSFSKYLAERDASLFKGVFDVYATKGLLAASPIYLDIHGLGDIALNQGIFEDSRKLMDQFLRGKPRPKLQQWDIEKSVLLIDEVDVFFGEHFYGQVRRPAEILNDDSMLALLRLAWNKRYQRDELPTLMKEMERRVLKQYPKLEPLLPKIVEAIVEVLKMMLENCSSKSSEDAIKLDDGEHEVGWSQDSGVYYKNPNTGDRDHSILGPFGLHTMFTYLYAVEGKYQETESQHRLDLEQMTGGGKKLKERIGISINCGQFLYSEIPKAFKWKLGLTGTLLSLSKPEKRILRQMGFQQHFATASVYKKQPLRGKYRVYICGGNKDETHSQNGYLGKIVAEVTDAKIKGRPCLVFCINDAEVEWVFANVKKHAGISAQYLEKLTLGMTAGQRDNVILKATEKNRVTICNAVYGRGTDFVCYDSETKTLLG